MNSIKYKVVVLCAVLCSVAGLQHSFAQKELKILSYNVLKGLQNDSLIQGEYIDWVNKLSPDIVAYQEMNGFTQKSLEQFAERYGHSYAIQSKLEGFPVALTSRYPIVNVQKVVDNMWHAYIYANVNNIHIFVIHFSPFSYKKRQAEMKQVLAHAATLPQNERILIMGDFNSLDASEAANHSQEYVKKMQERESKEAHVRNLNNGKIDYTVMSYIKDAGYKDTYWLTNKKATMSAPTKKYGPPSGRRIDYMWANPAMARFVKSSTVIHDATTDHISDHYPVFVTFDLK